MYGVGCLFDFCVLVSSSLLCVLVCCINVLFVIYAIGNFLIEKNGSKIPQTVRDDGWDFPRNGYKIFYSLYDYGIVMFDNDMLETCYNYCLEPISKCPCLCYQDSGISALLLLWWLTSPVCDDEAFAWRILCVGSIKVDFDKSWRGNITPYKKIWSGKRMKNSLEVVSLDK